MSLEEIADSLAHAVGLQGNDLKGPGGGHRISRLRDELVFAALHFFHYPAVKVARFFRLPPTAVTHSHQRIDRRISQDPQQAVQIKKVLLGE